MMIRPLVPADIPAVAGLLHELAREYIVHESPPEGAATFLAENGEMGVRGFLARGHVYHVAVAEGELAGFVAVRDRSHLFHLFVGKRWQRRGLARALGRLRTRTVAFVCLALVLITAIWLGIVAAGAKL